MAKKKRTRKKEFYGTYVDDKGYIRICAGPLRGIRVHTLIAMAKLGRPLKPDEIAHHADEDRLNPHPDNIEVWDKHNAHSAKQYHFLKQLQKKEEELWREYFGGDIGSPVPVEETQLYCN